MAPRQAVPAPDRRRDCRAPSATRQRLPDRAALRCRAACANNEGAAIADQRLVVTSRGLCRVPEGDDGIPIEEVYPKDTLPRSLQGSKFYEIPQGYVLGNQLEGANDQGPKPVRF